MREDKKYIMRHPGLKPDHSFFFMRHGWGVANAEGIIASRLTEWQPDLGLTDRGKKEVEVSAREFCELHKSDSFDIVSSPFRRARETAQIVGEILGASITVDSRLRERDFGVFEGTSDVNYEVVWKNDAKGAESAEFLVESLLSVTKRIESLVHEMAKRNRQRSVLLCSHGDVISIGLTYFAGKALSQHRAYGALATAKIREVFFVPIDVATRL